MRADCLLSLKSCDEEINNILPVVKSSAEKYLDILRNGIQSANYTINKGCKECEFRTDPNVSPNGFKGCLRCIRSCEPHIFDLYRGGNLGDYLNELISQEITSFRNFNPERFKKKNGELGVWGQRQLLQYQNTLAGKEFQHPELKSELNTLTYPLHFIDFETYISALPHHAGMRTYEKVTFQWSIHTVTRPGAAPIHREYLNDTQLSKLHFCQDPHGDHW